MGLGGDNRSTMAPSEHRSQLGPGGDHRSQQGGYDAASIATGSFHQSEWGEEELDGHGLDGLEGGESRRPPPHMIVHERNATDREGRHDAVSTRSVSPLGDERVDDDGEKGGGGVGEGR